MKLIGMLDSPYVRRVALCLDALGVAFEHESLSVFSTFDAFRAVNPVVKAPTLVCDDGTVLMDSSLILQYAEAGLPPARRLLWAEEADERRRQFRVTGLALAACEKSAQFVYETNLRPREAQYEPWLDRVRGQLQAAYAALEAEAQACPALFDGRLSHASIAAAVAWQFTRSLLAPLLPVDAHPALADFSARMEASPLFRRYPPVGPGVPVPALAQPS